MRRYACGECGREYPRDKLTVKRVVFQTMGEAGKTLRSRTLKWLCVTCLDADEDFNRDRLAESPGLSTEHRRGKQ